MYSFKAKSLTDYYELINSNLLKALALDEAGKPIEAYDVYKESVQLINQALSINLSDNELRQQETKIIIERLGKYKSNFSERMNEIYQLKRQMEEEKQKKFNPPPSQSWFGSLFGTSSSTQSVQPSISTSFQQYTPQHYQKMIVTSLDPSKTDKSPILQKKSESLSMTPSQDDKKSLDWKNIPEFKNIDEKLLKSILNEVMETGTKVKFDDIVGLEVAKQTLFETVILPSLRPEIFTGIRAPARGVLLFGPPGNGKTMLAKAISNESNTTFFNISASSLVSKWQGEGEKLVKALFAAARYLQPSIIFIDEIDSILTARKQDEHDSMRRLKTEFLVQMDGVSSGGSERVLIMGATNVPGDLDEAILRRFAKKIFIPLPEKKVRVSIILNLLKGQKIKFTKEDLDFIGEATERYSASDLNSLCKEMALIPIRELGTKILQIREDEMRPICYSDFKVAIKSIKPSCSQENLEKLKEWRDKFGQS